MTRYTTISNSELAEVIDNWVKGERDRKLMNKAPDEQSRKKLEKIMQDMK